MLQRQLLTNLFLHNLTESIVLSEQVWSDNGIKLQGERALLTVVLEDAISCYLKGAEWHQTIQEDLERRRNNNGMSKKCIRRGRNRKYRLAEEAKEWFDSKDTSPFTFEWICKHLNFDADYLRKGIASFQKGKIISADLIYRKKEIPMFLGSKRFSSDTIIALVRSYGKIEQWQGFTPADFRKTEFNYWRQLFAYVLRMYTEPRLSWTTIGTIIKCTHKTSENLFYYAVDSHYSRNSVFLDLLDDFKKRFEKLA